MINMDTSTATSPGVHMLTANGSSSTVLPETNVTYFETPAMEKVIAVVVPIIFGLIAVLGLVGNLLVMIVVISNKQMRNTTNLLIINLAIADLLFIVICVPFTGITYALPVWPFGNIFCKIYQYMIHATAYASVYTLVLMSLDRYLAVVHPICSMTIRTERNAYYVITLSWVVIFLLNIPILKDFEHHEYIFNGENRSVCANFKVMTDRRQGQIFYGSFFAFSYVVPLTTVCILYGFMLRRLLCGGVSGGNQSAERLRSKKRVTRMVVMVVAIFALCWLPIHSILMLQYFGTVPESTAFVGVRIASNCIAYMNSCVNPLLYAFLSENFRKSFRKLLCCYSNFQPVRLEYEKTNARGLEPVSKTTCKTPLKYSHDANNHNQNDDDNENCV